MLTRIVHPSPALHTFLQPLTAHLSQPQRQHLLEFADALLVCEDRKTLATLQRQFLDATDPSNWADFLRISPWSADLVFGTPCAATKPMAAGRSPTPRLPQGVLLNLDDSLGKKDKQTCAWNPSIGSMTTTNPPRNGPATTRPFAIWNARPASAALRPPWSGVYTCATRPCGGSTASFPGAAVAFPQQEPLGPRHPGVLQAAAAVGLGRLRPVRQLVRLGAAAQVCPPPRLARRLRPEEQPEVARATPPPVRYHLTAQAVHARARDRCGRARRPPTTCGMPWGGWRNVPFDVRVLFSKRHPRARSWAYFLSTDLARSVVETLRGYGGRWSCEVVNFYVKTQLGLADFRVRSFEAVDRYVVAVHLAWAYVEQRLAASVRRRSGVMAT